MKQVDKEGKMLSKIRQWLNARKQNRRLSRIKYLNNKALRLAEEREALKKEGTIIGGLVLVSSSSLHVDYCRLLYKNSFHSVFCEKESAKVEKELKELSS